MSVEIFGADTNAAGHASSIAGQRALDPALSQVPTGSAAAIREQLATCSPPPAYRLPVEDLGDLDIQGSPIEQAGMVRAACEAILDRGHVPACLGGDHLVKIGCLQAIEQLSGTVGILYLDAHPDTLVNDEFRYDTVVHHALKSGRLRPRNFAIVGLRQFNSAECEGLARYQPTIVSGHAFAELKLQFMAALLEDSLSGCDSLYVSIDPDGLNPSEARAVEQPYPGGPTADQFLALTRYLLRSRRLVGFDVSEHLPALDEDRLTSITLAHIVSGLLATEAPGRHGFPTLC